MSQIMLKSPREEVIRPLVISALESKKNELTKPAKNLEFDPTRRTVQISVNPEP